MAGENIEGQEGLVARFIDGQGPQFVEAVSTKSKMVNSIGKFLVTHWEKVKDRIHYFVLAAVVQRMSWGGTNF